MGGGGIKKGGGKGVGAVGNYRSLEQLMSQTCNHISLLDADIAEQAQKHMYTPSLHSCCETENSPLSLYCQIGSY